MLGLGCIFETFKNCVVSDNPKIIDVNNPQDLWMAFSHE